MTPMILRKVLVACLLLAPVCCPGGGSCDFEEDVKPILMQEPALADYLLSTLDFYRTASAVRIGGIVNQELGGKRIGPYTIDARPRGLKGPYIFLVTINTERLFFDKDHKKTDLQAASTVEEKLTSVEIVVSKNPLSR
jgi:hypothetical protein